MWRRIGLAGQTRSVAADREGQARRVAADAGLGPDVQDVVGRAASAAARAFVVAYDSPDGARTTVSQDPPSKRVDVTGGPGGQGIVRTALVNTKGSFACEKVADRWTCRRSATAPPVLGSFDPSNLKSTVDQLSASRRSYDFRIEHRTVAGTAATCLVTERKPGAPGTGGQVGRLCVAANGAPLLIAQPGQTLTAVSYSTTVPKATFDLPARSVRVWAPWSRERQRVGGPDIWWCWWSWRSAQWRAPAPRPGRSRPPP